jgi:CelD/BcsL family acetyltransferase involved in cellulose biosynthesis
MVDDPGRVLEIRSKVFQTNSGGGLQARDLRIGLPQRGILRSADFEDCRREHAEVFVLDPLRDHRWSEFIERHPDASIFHSTGWLEALRRTYGYEPLVVTTSGRNEPLSNGIVLCKVRSWATGDRLISLPFSDHCDPLIDDRRGLEALIAFLKAEVERGHCRYLEMRPVTGVSSGISQSMHLEKDEAYCIHQLDLRPSLDELYHKFHKSCVQRKIRKAKREELLYEDGRSEELLSKFYKLLLQTRRRHQLPPQSMAWFRNLADCLGERLKVRVVSKDGRPIASIITTHFRDTGVYKYGCSDARYHNLGGMLLLMWHAIQDAKASGARCFDLGRSKQENRGLVTFKEHWGSTKISLPYRRYPAGIKTDVHSGWKLWLVQKSCAYLSDPLLGIVGTVLYKHVG